MRCINYTQVAVGGCIVSANTTCKRIPLIKRLGLGKGKTATKTPAAAYFPIKLFTKGISCYQIYVVAAVVIGAVYLLKVIDGIVSQVADDITNESEARTVKGGTV